MFGKTYSNKTLVGNWQDSRAEEKFRQEKAREYSSISKHEYKPNAPLVSVGWDNKQVTDDTWQSTTKSAYTPQYDYPPSPSRNEATPAGCTSEALGKNTPSPNKHTSYLYKTPLAHNHKSPKSKH